MEKDYLLTENWVPILEALDIPIEHIDRVAEFVSALALNESMASGTLTGVGVGNITPPSELKLNTEAEFVSEEKSLVPLCLSIIAKIKDLSKVEFMHAPKQGFGIRDETKFISAGSLVLKVKIERDIIDSIVHATELYESIIINEVSRKLNEDIDKYGKIYLYQPVSKIQVVVEGTLVPEMYITSRYANEPEITKYNK